MNGANGGGLDVFFGGAVGFGLGEVVRVVGSAVTRGYLLAVAVGGEACGVAGLVGLDEDGGGFTNGVVEGEGDGLNQGVVDGFIVGLLRHVFFFEKHVSTPRQSPNYSLRCLHSALGFRNGLAASATHCRQGKRRYEGSR